MLHRPTVIRLLVITEDHTPAPTLSTALSSLADCQCVHRAGLEQAQGALSVGAFDVVLLQPAASDAGLVAAVGRARAQSSRIGLVVLLPAGSALPPASLYAAGADSVLPAPVEPATLAALLQRLADRSQPAAGLAAGATPSAGALPLRAAALSSALEVLRDFSQVLGYSLDHRQLTQHFIQKLREVVGLTRIAIFLESGTDHSLAGDADPGRLGCAAAVGLSADLVECFALSRQSGLGRQMLQQPQILRHPAGGSAPGDGTVAREFEVLGGQVALPVTDRERTLGVAVLGGRLTGGGYTDEELLLVYHLLEELGIAVKNSWLHRQLVGSHQLLARVLDGLTVGALVAGPQARVLYANRAIADFLGRPGAGLELTDLPAAIARPLHDAVERGAAAAPFYHEAEGRVHRVSCLPLRPEGAGRPQTALLLLEDFTSVRAAQQAEIESSNLKLISLIARRFAHEIRNSLVPLTTHAQLFDSQIADAEFQASLKAALERETRRIQRFTDQMLLLARSDQPATELTPLDELLQASFARSRAYAGVEAELDVVTDLPPVMLRCNRAGLAHAFEEIFLNGLQSGEAGAGPRRLTVTLNAAPTDDARAELVIAVRDSGGGFAADAAPRATEPFFTTRNTGVGLGLTIARRVIEAHSGRLQVQARQAAGDPDLTIRLPLPR